MRLNSFQLKIIAMLFMLLDHLYTFIPGTFPIWFGYLGKLSAPIFFYLIVEGFFHTRNRTKYMTRLFGFGGIMMIINVIFDIHNNIFLSLGLAVALMSVIEYAKTNKKYVAPVILALIIAAAMMFTEASLYGVWMTLVFYFLRDKKLAMGISYCALSFLPLASMSAMGLEAIFLWDYQWMMGFAIIFIYLYNGELGLRNNFTKWMFYLFYPLHLIILNLMG